MHVWSTIHAVVYITISIVYMHAIRLYDRMDDLLEVELAVPHMAEMLAEVFTGGLELCLKVKEEQIERLFQLISRPDKDGIPELVFTLQAMAKV